MKVDQLYYTVYICIYIYIWGGAAGCSLCIMTTLGRQGKNPVWSPCNLGAHQPNPTLPYNIWRPLTQKYWGQTNSPSSPSLPPPLIAGSPSKFWGKQLERPPSGGCRVSFCQLKVEIFGDFWVFESFILYRVNPQ